MKTKEVIDTTLISAVTHGVGEWHWGSDQVFIPYTSYPGNLTASVYICITWTIYNLI